MSQRFTSTVIAVLAVTAISATAISYLAVRETRESMRVLQEANAAAMEKLARAISPNPVEKVSVGEKVEEGDVNFKLVLDDGKNTPAAGFNMALDGDFSTFATPAPGGVISAKLPFGPHQLELESIWGESCQIPLQVSAKKPLNETIKCPASAPATGEISFSAECAEELRKEKLSLI